MSDQERSKTVGPSGARNTAVRQALIDAARLEFAEQGYAGARTREIANRAGTSEVMLYRYFGSKANLFKETVFLPFDENISQFIEREFSDSSPRALSATAWRKYSKELFALLDDNQALLNALIAACNYTSDEILGVHDLTSLEKYFVHATEALARSTDETEPGRASDPEILVRLVFGLVASVVLFGKWLFPPEVASPEKVIDVMQRFVEQAYGISCFDPPVGPGEPTGKAS